MKICQAVFARMLTYHAQSVNYSLKFDHYSTEYGKSQVFSGNLPRQRADETANRSGGVKHYQQLRDRHGEPECVRAGQRRERMNAAPGFIIA